MYIYIYINILTALYAFWCLLVKKANAKGICFTLPLQLIIPCTLNNWMNGTFSIYKYIIQ